MSVLLTLLTSLSPLQPNSQVTSVSGRDPSQSIRLGVKKTLIKILRKTLSAGAVTYHEALEEINPNESEATTSPVFVDVRDCDLEEAILRSLEDAKRTRLETVYELERETWENANGTTYYADEGSSNGTSYYTDEGSSNGTMTPDSDLSSRPSTSSGLFQEDLKHSVHPSDRIP